MMEPPFASYPVTVRIRARRAQDLR